MYQENGKVNSDYMEFVQKKIVTAVRSGFTVKPDDINPALFEHQRDIVQWALDGGRRAIFAAFGLGKSFMQLEAMKHINLHEGGRQLIICPLGVRQEFKADAAKLGMSISFVRRSEEVSGPGLYLTNYESVRDGRLDVNLFNAVSLDEASVLRSFGSKTYQTFLDLFSAIKYRFVATATPSPNRYKELIHYAGFLGVMDTGEALTRFFQRDSTQANNLTIYTHKEKEFWAWVSSWAIFLQRPSDLGYSDEGYDLPKLHVHYHEVKSSTRRAKSKDGQLMLFADAAISLKDASAEKRNSLENRVLKLKEIVDAIQRSVESERIQGCILQEAQEGFNRQADGQGRSEDRRGNGLQEGILQAEQGISSGKATDAEQAELRRKEGCLCRKVENVGKCKPGEDELFNQKEQIGEHSEIFRLQEDVLPEQHGRVGCQCANIENEAIRNNTGSIRKHDGEARRCVCNLRNGERSEESVLFTHRSLSQDGQSQGPVVRKVQCDVGDGKGQRSEFEERDPIPQFIVWVDLNDEQKAVEKALKEMGISYVSLYGNTDIEKRDVLISQWKNKEKTVFISKPEMYGSGINMQQCHIEIFLGINYGFNDFFQSIKRIHRFLQEKECHIHIIYADTERRTLEVLRKKWKQHEEMVEKMSEIIRANGLSNKAMIEELVRAIGVERIEVKGKLFVAANNDCVVETRAMEENSVDLIHTSIPFSNHYEYTPSYNDFGHTKDNNEFWEQMDYLTPELLRVLRPGRIYACHVKDRILFGNVTGKGVPTVSPFHAETIFHCQKHGFDYMGMITVVTDVVRENNQTYRLGWSEQCKDGTKMGAGSPEYIILMRKPQTDRSRGYADIPVTKSKDDYSRSRWQVDAHAFWRSSGNRLVTADEMAKLAPDALAKVFTDYSLESIYDYEEHVQIGERLDAKGALPATFMSLAPGSHHQDVWHDVCRMLSLNGEQSRRGLTSHICPLQFDIVDRIITRFSNPGELVFDPFGGLGTVPYRAILLGRRGRCVELNHEYFLDSIKYLRAAEEKLTAPTLFDCLGFERPAAQEVA